MSEAQAPAPAAPAAPPPVMPPPVAPVAPVAPPAGDVPEWRASLPPEIRDAPGVTKFKSVEELARGYVNAETVIGKKGVILPGDNAAPEELAKFREAIGVPAAPDGYKLAGKEGAPPEVWNDATAKEIAAFAHEAALTPKQAQALADRWVKLGMDGSAITAAENERQYAEGKANLEKEWGSKYDENIEAATRAAKTLAGDDVIALLAEKGLANNTLIIKMFKGMGEKMGEDSPAAIGGARGGPAGGDPKAELAELMKAGSPYWNPLHPQHRDANQRALKLHEQIGAAR